MKTYVIWGTGAELQKNIDSISWEQVTAVIDGNSDKHGTLQCGKTILPPEKIVELEFDYVIIFTSKYFAEISSELIFKYGIDSKKILSSSQVIKPNSISKAFLWNQIKRICDVYNVNKILDINAGLGKTYYWNIEKNRQIDAWIEEKCSSCYFDIYQSVYNRKNMPDSIYPIAVCEPMDIKVDDEILKQASCVIMPKMIEAVEEIKTGCDTKLYAGLINLGGIQLPVYYSLKKNVSIYQVTHKGFAPVSEYPYQPIHAGKKGKVSLGYQGDDTGDNISGLNAILNECTALYWIWKNDTSDYIGLNHYRRVFESPLNKGWMLQECEIHILLEQYDVVVAQGHSTDKWTLEELLQNEVCDEAFQIAYRALQDIFSEMDECNQRALSYIMQGHMLYPCNMFIMRRELLDEYCSWLFPVLFELVERVEIKGEWDGYSKRIVGFLAERMLTVWLIQKNLRIKELPVLLLDNEKAYGK